MTAAKTANSTSTKTSSTKKKHSSKADKPPKAEKKNVASQSSVGLDPALVDKAIRALLQYHEKTTRESEKQDLLGNDRPVTVQFTLLRAPAESRPKPIPIAVPHPLFKTAQSKEDGNNYDDAMEEPEICLIVKEESKPWCQEMIAKFPDHMGGIRKVLGLDSLRKKHCVSYEKRRELLHKYNLFLADDRILPMLSKLLGKAFIQTKRLPIPISITRETALPFAIQKALSATYMTLNKGTCVSVKAGHTGMTPEQLVANVVAIGKEATPKLPRKWANVQMMGIKTADSMSLPIYNQTPEKLREIARMAGLEDPKPVVERKCKKQDREKQIDPKKDSTAASKKRELKSPLLKALKKQKLEEADKEKTTAQKSEKKRKDDANVSDIKSGAKSTSEKAAKREGNDGQSKKEKTSVKDSTKKSAGKDINDGTKKAEESKSKTHVSDKEDGKKKTDFVAAKKWKGSKKGYVFRMGAQGLGYYVDVKPFVNSMALEAIMKMGKGNNANRRGGSKKNKYKGTRRF